MTSSRLMEIFDETKLTNEGLTDIRSEQERVAQQKRDTERGMCC